MQNKKNPGEISKPNLAQSLDTAYSLMNLFLSVIHWCGPIFTKIPNGKDIGLTNWKAVFKECVKLVLGISFFTYSEKTALASVSSSGSQN